MSSNAGVSLTVLRTLPIFETLNDECLRPLTRVAMLRKVPRHTVVLHAGDRTDNIYFVLSGVLKVQVSDEEGREVILSMLGPGELFGEMGVLDDHPRSATVLAVESSEVVVMGKEDFKQCLVENPDVSLFIMRNLTAQGLIQEHDGQLILVDLAAFRRHGDLDQAD